MRTRAMRQQAIASLPPLPPHLVMTWLPIRDVASALRVSKEWRGASEPIFQAIAGRHGLQRVQPQHAQSSWRATVRHYRSSLGQSFSFGLGLRGMGLIGAAAIGDVPAIQRCISEGVNPSFATGAGQTALHIAAMWGHLDALNALIAAGADLNAQNCIRNDYQSDCNWGGTPLHVAANSNKAPLSRRYYCAQRLIEAGANARLLNDEEDAPHQSQFPAHQRGPDEPSFFDFSGVGPETFRKLLKDAYHAQR